MGNIPTLNKVLSTLVKDVYTGLEEAWDKKDQNFEPSKIVIKLDWGVRGFPFDLVERIKSAGVRVLAEIQFKGKSQQYWAGGRRRVLEVLYPMHQNTEIKGALGEVFAGRIISVIKQEWPAIYRGNLVAKGEAGYLASVAGELRGELIE